MMKGIFGSLPCWEEAMSCPPGCLLPPPEDATMPPSCSFILKQNSLRRTTRSTHRTLFTSVTARQRHNTGRKTTHTEGRKPRPPHTDCTAEGVLDSITGRAGTMGEVYSQQRHTVPFTSSQFLPLMKSAAGV